jgi:activator of 2-hydroxyglutaryl-CoA dehydratase
VLAVRLQACHQWDKSYSDSTKTSKLTQLTIFVHKIGIDLGGTKIEGILLDEKYNTIQRKRIKTHQENGYDSIVKSIISLINEL